MSTWRCGWICTRSYFFAAEAGLLARRRRFHPLGDTELLTDDGVTQSARTDLNRNQLTGVKSYA